MSESPEVVVCSPERLSTLVESAVSNALARERGVAAQLLVDKKTLADRLSCSAEHIDHLRKKGLPVVWVGKALRFDPAAVLAWLAGGSP